MGQADSLLITGRRNFLVRALGFAAVPAAAAVPIVGLPTISPEIIQSMEAWKAAYLKYEAVYCALHERDAQGRLVRSMMRPPGTLTPFGEHYHDTRELHEAARDQMMKAILRNGGVA